MTFAKVFFFIETLFEMTQNVHIFSSFIALFKYVYSSRFLDGWYLPMEVPA